MLHEFNGKMDLNREFQWGKFKKYWDDATTLRSIKLINEGEIVNVALNDTLLKKIANNRIL